MDPFQAMTIPETQKKFMSQLAHDFRAAISYVSFYPINSSFVTQAIQKLHKDFQKVLHSVNPLYIHVQDDKLYANDYPLSPLDDLLSSFKDQNLQGVEITKDISLTELTAWLQVITFPFEENKVKFHKQDKTNIRPLSGAVQLREPSKTQVMSSQIADSAATLMQNTPPSDEPMDKNRKALLSFVAEAWQFSQLQRRTLGSNPEMIHLLETFDQLFNRLLDRMERSSPDFSNISAWFKNPTGDFLAEGATSSMYSLLEIAMENGWPSVLFDPATEGLVSDCLTYWSERDRQDLVEKTVFSLADGLRGNPLERQLALTHLMDARPWVKNAKVVEKVLDQLNFLIASEVYPGTYQSALLLAWDLVEAAMDLKKEQPVLTLLATLHFQADEDIASFPECSSIARHWLYERSTPELIRRLVDCAHHAGKLNHFPLLGEMAAPLLLEDYFSSTPAQRLETLGLLYEIRESVRSVLVELLASAEEEKVWQVLPLLDRCGLDAPLALQLSSWITKGTSQLKQALLDLLDKIHLSVGGLALRPALLDESTAIAVKAAGLMGQLQFPGGTAILLKASEKRAERFPENEDWIAAVCFSLGELGQKESIEFLGQVANKKIGKKPAYSSHTRLQAFKALAKIRRPEALRLLQDARKEESPELREAVEKLLQEKSPEKLPNEKS